MTLPPQEKPKEKTIFNVKLESFDAGSKPKVIKEVKAMVPNLTLIEVRPITITLGLARNAHRLFPLFRRRSLLSRYQRSSRRTCPRRTPRSSRKSLKDLEPSSHWSKLETMISLIILLPPHSLPNPRCPSKPTYHPHNLMHV